MNKLIEKTTILAITIIMCVLIALSLCGCYEKSDEESGTGLETNRFVRVESQRFAASSYTHVFYDKETKVMYVFYKDGYGGGLCPMYNSDGTLMLYEY